jgi:hypothetical protein
MFIATLFWIAMKMAAQGAFSAHVEFLAVAIERYRGRIVTFLACHG